MSILNSLEHFIKWLTKASLIACSEPPIFIHQPNPDARVAEGLHEARADALSKAILVRLPEQHSINSADAMQEVIVMLCLTVAAVTQSDALLAALVP